MEVFDLYDENNQPLNQAKERKKVHQDGDWHRTSQVWVINEKGEVLCNLRSWSKDLFPDYWDLTIGGHVITGDSYESTAVREMEEELGVDIKESELIFLSDEKVEGVDIINNLIDREHVRLFLYHTRKNINEFKVQKDEIEKIVFISIENLYRIIRHQNSSDFKIVPIKHHLPKILKIIEDIIS